jgi:hypothetical protein
MDHRIEDGEYLTKKKQRRGLGNQFLTTGTTRAPIAEWI